MFVKEILDGLVVVRGVDEYGVDVSFDCIWKVFWRVGVVYLKVFCKIGFWFVFLYGSGFCSGKGFFNFCDVWCDFGLDCRWVVLERLVEVNVDCEIV